MNTTSHLTLCPLKHNYPGFWFALITEVWKWHARKKASGNVIAAFVNSRCLPCNATGFFHLKRFNILGRAWKHSSKAATLGRNWKVLGDPSPSFLATVMQIQWHVEDFRLEGIYCALYCASVLNY